MRVFRKRSLPAPDSLKSAFIDLYFNNPWAGSDHPSFVYCDAENRVRGFVGAIPLPMKIGGSQFIASVAGNNMVDPDLKDPFAGVFLLRKLLASNPLLTISDSANEISRTLWTKLGAHVLTLQSMRWLRILQPTEYALSTIPKENKLSGLKPLLRPVCKAADSLVSRVFMSLPRLDRAYGTHNLDVQTLLRAFPEVIGRRMLFPDYTAEGLTWLLDMAAKKEQYGALHNVAVKGASGSIVGWYMYYANPGNVAQVLQYAARKTMEGVVLNNLFEHAKARGCVAVVGGIETNSVKEFSENQCLFFLRSMYTVAYSQDTEITNALIKGDAFISRLEGEWWTRLQGDTF
jgi:hypothetical protein